MPQSRTNHKQLGFGILSIYPVKKNERTHAKNAALVWAGFELFKQKIKKRKPEKQADWQKEIVELDTEINSETISGAMLQVLII